MVKTNAMMETVIPPTERSRETQKKMRADSNDVHWVFKYYLNKAKTGNLWVIQT